MRRALLAIVLALTPVGAFAQSVGNGSVASISANQASALLGNSFMAGSTLTAVSTGSNLRYLFTNPSASGVNCLVYEIQAFGTGAAPTAAHIWYNPTSGLATTARPVMNLNTGSTTTSSCTAKADVGAAVSGGTDTGVDLPIPTATFLDIVAQTFVVGPGTSVGINVPFALAASGTLTIFWRQTPMGGS